MIKTVEKQRIINYFSPRVIKTEEDYSAAADLYISFRQFLAPFTDIEPSTPTRYPFWFTSEGELKTFRNSRYMEIPFTMTEEPIYLTVGSGEGSKTFKSKLLTDTLSYSILMMLYHDLSKKDFYKAHRIRPVRFSSYRFHFINPDELSFVNISGDTINKTMDTSVIEQKIKRMMGYDNKSSEAQIL